MKIKSFDIDTAKEVVGDARVRNIEAKARADAEAGKRDAPIRVKGTYWDGIQSDMEFIVYITAHQKRLDRMERINEREAT